jgi:hypothetical protein
MDLWGILNGLHHFKFLFLVEITGMLIAFLGGDDLNMTTIITSFNIVSGSRML